jgi:translation elongation factor EF-Tu-like GTPase
MFALQVSDIFSIHGRGMVLTGRVEGASVFAGTRVRLVAPASSVRAVVAALEIDRKVVPSATPGQNVAVLVRGVEREALVGAFEKVESETGVSIWRVVSLRLEAEPRMWWEFC